MIAASPTIKSLAATLLVSILPNFILFFIPTSILTSSNKRYVGTGLNLEYLPIFISFACGGLLGDVFLHIVPDLLSLAPESHGHHDHNDHYDHHDHHDYHNHEEHHDHDHTHAHSHGNTSVGLCILTGFLVFFLVEKVVSHYAHTSMHSYNHDHTSMTAITSTTADDSKTRRRGRSRSKSTTKTGSRSTTTPAKSPAAAASTIDICDRTSVKSYLSLFYQLNPLAILNIIADSMHNFTDGLAIGVSFASSSAIHTDIRSNKIFLATFLSILMHEIPHEIGDFTVLISSGMTKWEAIKTQFITAVAAFAGTIVGIYLKDNKEYRDVLLAVTAGGFLYISTVGMMPLLLKKKEDNQSVFLQIILELVSFISGVGCMVIVTYLE